MQLDAPSDGRNFRLILTARNLRKQRRHSNQHHLNKCIETVENLLGVFVFRVRERVVNCCGGSHQLDDRVNDPSFQKRRVRLFHSDEQNGGEENRCNIDESSNREIKSRKLLVVFNDDPTEVSNFGNAYQAQNNDKRHE